MWTMLEPKGLQVTGAFKAPVLKEEVPLSKSDHPEIVWRERHTHKPQA